MGARVNHHHHSQPHRDTRSRTPRTPNTPNTMPVLCIGPVCIPLNLLLPFLLGLAHRYGWLQWVKK